MASPQLFYSYTSTSGLLAESEKAIKDNSNYDYSLSFDINRKSIWTGKNEYGIPRIERDELLTLDTITSGTNTTGYYGNITYMYTNEHGAISIYETAKIINFECYDINGNQVLDLPMPVGQTITANNLTTFKLEYVGTSVENSVKLKIYKNTNTLANNIYEGSFDISDFPVDIHRENFHYAGQRGDIIYANIDITDSAFHTNESMTIKLIEFKDYFYYGVGVGQPDIATQTTGAQVEPIVNGVIPYSANQPDYNYFWFFTPAYYSVVMQQGGGESDRMVFRTYASYNGIPFIINRTLRSNVGGAHYSLMFTQMNNE